jgi:ABC-2 type transport system permease protein
MQVANGVAIEKANRISEVLLAIVPPSPLLFGKVIGIGLTALAGFAIGASPIVATAAFGDGLPAGMGAALASGAAWLVLGLALYLVVAGALGALVERPEQAGSVMSPLMVVLVASLVVGQSAPDSTVAMILAYIPFSSPVVEPARIAVGASSPVEMAVSLVATLVAVVLAVRIGAAIYRRAIVRTGRVTVRQVLRAV